MSALPFISDTFDPARWREVEGFTLTDMTYHRGISRGEAEDGHPKGADMPVPTFETPSAPTPLMSSIAASTTHG